MANERILVVDDERGVRDALEGILRDEGFDVVSAESGEDGLALLEKRSCDAVLLDIWLPGMDGLAALQQLRERWTDIEVVMISGHGNIDTAVRATKLGAFDFVEKPLSLEKTLLVLRNALRHGRLEKRNRHLVAQLTRDTEILGRSAAADRLRREVEAAATAHGPVLVRGEPGCGRELVARRIHGAGRFSEGPFVDVPCGSMSREDAEAALFGQEERPARVRLARGGTLFLEEIDRLDRAQQRRIAASLGRWNEPRSFRTIASAGTDAAALDDSLGAVFDLFRIHVPALSERREDIPMLAERFLADLAREHGREPKRLAKPALGALKTHDWPGNVRQLHGVMERLLLTAPGEEIRLEELPEALGGADVPAEDLYREFGSLAEGLAAFERYYIARVLAEEQGDHATAAGRLGLDLAELERRLKHGP